MTHSVYVHDTRNGQYQVVKEGQSGWVLQVFTPRASFRRNAAQWYFLLYRDVAPHHQPFR